MPEIKPPSVTFLQTSEMPPAFCTPTMTTASWPANITTVWNTSVQMTAFSPPYVQCQILVQRDSMRKSTYFYRRRKIQKNNQTVFTSAVYIVHTSPVANTVPHKWKPVTKCRMRRHKQTQQRMLGSVIKLSNINVWLSGKPC